MNIHHNNTITILKLWKWSLTWQMVSSCVIKWSQNHVENDPQDSRSKTNYSQNPKTIKNRPSPQIHQQRLPISKQVHHSQARFWKNPTPTAGSMDPEAICLGEFHKDVEVLDILLQHRLSKRLRAKFQPLGEVSSNCAECFPTFSARFSKMAWHFGMIPRLALMESASRPMTLQNESSTLGHETIRARKWTNFGTIGFPYTQEMGQKYQPHKNGWLYYKLWVRWWYADYPNSSVW